MMSMAKIVHSEAAPSEAVHYTFVGVEFDLGGRKKSYETDDAAVLSNAEAHPWLTVERETVEPIQGAYVEQLRPEDDHLSSLNSKANDPEAVRAAEEAKREAADNPVAIEAGKDQTEVVETGGVAETVAAVDSTPDKKDKN